VVIVEQDEHVEHVLGQPIPLQVAPRVIVHTALEGVRGLFYFNLFYSVLFCFGN
jgi:hypothetical protein